MIVVDASVWMSYLMLTDAYHDVSRRWLATALAENRVIVAPVLLLAEIGGATARLTNRPDLGRRAIDQLLAVPNLRLVGIDHELGIRTAQTAADRLLRGADASYVTVAAALGIPLVSWDRQQLERAAGLVQAYMPE